MHLNLKNTSKTQRRLIREAASITSQAQAKRLGWRFIGRGAFKVAYKKGSVVLKFAHGMRNDSEEHVETEADFYSVCRKNDKKYLARIYGSDHRRIIQQFIPLKPKGHSDKDNTKILRVAKRLMIDDVLGGHNATIYRGIPKIFDYGLAYG